MCSKSQEIDFIKQLQILFYIYKLVQKYKVNKYEVAIRRLDYLNHHLFENSVYGTQDYNLVLIIPLKLALRLSFSSGCWVLAKFFTRDLSHKRTHIRWVKIIIDYNLKQDKNCYVSSILYHNLKEKLGHCDILVEVKYETMIYSVYLVTRLYAIWNTKIDIRSIFSTYYASLHPKYANEVSLSFVSEPLKLFIKDISDVEMLLQHHFTYPRYLHIGDVIAISIPIPQDIFHDSLDYIFWPKFLYFYVTSINGSIDISLSESGYLISKSKTTLYLSGTEKKKIPYLYYIINTNEEKLPPCLKNIFNKICVVFEFCQCFNKLEGSSTKEDTQNSIEENNQVNNSNKYDSHMPNILSINTHAHILLIGPTGSGKVKIIKLLAEKYSYCIKWIDCLGLKGDTSAATEGKIHQAFSHIQPNTIIVLTRIGNLSEVS